MLLGRLINNLRAKHPLHADGSRSGFGRLHRNVDGFRGLEPRRDAGNAAVGVERTADLDIGEAERRVGAAGRAGQKQEHGHERRETSHHLILACKNGSADTARLVRW